MKIEIDQIAEAIEEELTIYSDHVIEGVKKTAKQKMRQLVKKTKDTAPVGTRKKHYKSNIAAKKLGETTRQIS